MAKSFIDVIQDSYRMSVGIHLKTKNPLFQTILPLPEPTFGFELHEPRTRSANQGAVPARKYDFYWPFPLLRLLCPSWSLTLITNVMNDLLLSIRVFSCWLHRIVSKVEDLVSFYALVEFFRITITRSMKLSFCARPNDRELIRNSATTVEAAFPVMMLNISFTSILKSKGLTSSLTVWTIASRCSQSLSIRF